jgi:cyclohexyl-isocyanide hydratase
MRFQMLVYPGMTLLDLVGPAQTWAALPGVEMQFVWKERGPIATDAGLAVIATHSFAESWERPDVLFVPGGTIATFSLFGDDETIAFLAQRGNVASWVTSVCTGAHLLGAAGLLAGYRATSHWSMRDTLARFGATPVDARYVFDRNRATGGGVTAGIDFGLALIAQVLGEAAAREVQLGMEYAPAPPFASGHPREALPETVAAVLARFAADGSGDMLEMLFRKAEARLAAAAPAPSPLADPAARA